MALVIVSHGSAAARFQQQARLGPIERLVLALFIETEDQRIIGMVQVKGDDVNQLLSKLPITTHLERRQLVGPQGVQLPNAAHCRLADTLRFGHDAGTAVRGVRGSAVQRGFHNHSSLLVADRRDAAGTWNIPLQHRGAQCQKVVTPQMHRRSRGADLLGEIPTLDPLGGQQDDPRPLNESLGLASGSGPSPQGSPLLVGKQHHRSSSAHAEHETRGPQISKAIYDAAH